MGILLPYIESYSINYLSKEIYGKARLYGSLGFVVVSLVLAKNLENPFTGLWYLLFCIFMTIIFALSIVSKNKKFETTEKQNSEIKLTKHARFWVTIFLLQVSFGAFYNFFTIYETSFGVSLESVSWMWAFGVICETLFFYFQTPIIKNFSLNTLIRFSALMTAIRWLILYLFPTSLYLTFFSQSFHAISFALLHTAAFAYVQQLYPKNRALASQFYYGFSYGLGAFIGALLAGFTYGKYLFLCSFLVALVAFFTSKKKD